MITFLNGKSFETINIFGSKTLYQGQQREILQIDIEADKISFEEAKDIYTSAECLKEITVSADDSKYLYLNYVIPVELVYTSKRKLYGMDDDTNVISMKIAQKTKLETDIEDAQSAIIELANYVGGNT